MIITGYAQAEILRILLDSGQVNSNVRAKYGHNWGYILYFNLLKVQMW
jgi:hypothetical protein